MAIRHEHSLQILEAQQPLCLFLTTKDNSILPQLYQTSMEWKTRHENGQCEVSLRTARAGVMLKEMSARFKKSERDPLNKFCPDAGWFTQDKIWKCLALVTTTSLESLSISIVRDLYNLDWIGSLRCDIVIVRDDLLPLADLASHWPACAVNALQ